MIVRISYSQPGVRLDLWGGTSGTFAGLDLFNRIIDQRWQNSITGTPTDIDRYQYGYDQNSNRLYKANVVGTPIVSGGLDEFYAYDHLNRLTEMQRGTLNGTNTGITGTPSREMDWTLDPTGNWPAYLAKTSGTTDLSQSRTSNTVNEITAIGGTPGWVTPAYDAAGNTTTMPQPAAPTSSFTAVYDAWNRMVNVSAGGSTVATYTYDGRNRRIVKVMVSPAETRHFYFTNQWQDVEERVGTSTSMDKQYVWGTRYIDELVCRDDVTPERLYACQDANYNLTAITNTSGTVEERYLFDPYANRTIMNASWGVIGSSGYDWVIGHQGLMEDGETGMVCNRTRMMHTALGRFTARDLLSYLDGVNLYEYVHGQPVALVDPDGTFGQNECWSTFILPLKGAALKALKDAAKDCAKDGVLPPPFGKAEDWRKCIMKKPMGAAQDAAAKFACCLLPNWVQGGATPNPDDRTVSAVNCQQHCDWVACQSDAKDPESSLIGDNFATTACYAKCCAQADWNKW